MKTTLIWMILATAPLTRTAHAVSHPEIKEGEWSVHTVSVENGSKRTEGTYKLCRSHAFDQYVEGLAKNVKTCKMIGETYAGGKYTSESRCTMGKTVIASKGTTTFQSDTSMHSETHATYTPPMYGMSDTQMTMDQKYVGSCPAGTQPGDRTNADGTVMHLWKH